MSISSQTDPSTLLERALQLTAEARKLASGQEAQQAERRTTTNLTALETALTAMAESAKAHQEAARLGVPLARMQWGAGRQNLTEHVRRGRPSAQALLNATKQVKATTTTANQELKESWSAWAATKLSDPVLLRLPLLPESDRGTYRGYLDRLKSLASAKQPPKAHEIAEFGRHLDNLTDVLGCVTADENLTALITRIAGGVRLSDLTDAELAQLRQHPQLADQIWLTRR